MGSMNLSPELKAAADAIYHSDPIRFKRLAIWIAQGRKHGYSEPNMADALKDFAKKDPATVDEWYPYLDTILSKVEKNRNRDGAVLEHERHKDEVREASRIFAVK
jgi:hypothetical protein